MTLWIGVDYIEPWYYLVGIQNLQPIFFKKLSFEQWISHPLTTANHHWVVKIPAHEVDLDKVKGEFYSPNDCLQILKQQYGSSFVDYQFSVFYLGLYQGIPYWSIARVPKATIQEYLCRFKPIIKNIDVLELDMRVIWLYVFHLFKNKQWGCVFYQQRGMFYALLGKQEWLMAIHSSCSLEQLKNKILVDYPWIVWTCCFNDVPKIDTPWVSYEIEMDSIWRMSFALAFRGEYDAD